MEGAVEDAQALVELPQPRMVSGLLWLGGDRLLDGR